MIIDCFTFFDEYDILEIRLHELDKWVDRFVLVECRETYSGEKKPLWFETNKKRFESFLPKIVHLIAPPYGATDNFWHRIKNQIDYCQKALTNCVSEDLVLIGDVDEIPKGQNFIQAQLIDGLDMAVFVQKQYFFYLNLLRPGGWPGTILIKYDSLKNNFKNSLFGARKKRRGGHAVVSGGWHFTKIGDIDSVALKLRSSGHYNLPSVKKMWSDKKILHDQMEVSRRIKGRNLEVVPIDEHPKWFCQNIDKFKHLLTK